MFGKAIDAAITMMLFISALAGAVFVGVVWLIIYICQHIYWEWV